MEHEYMILKDGKVLAFSYHYCVRKIQQKFHSSIDNNKFIATLIYIRVPIIIIEEIHNYIYIAY